MLENRNVALPLAIPDEITKSVAPPELNTVPVGKPPGMGMPAKPGSPFLTKGEPATSPLYRLDVLVPLFETQKGLEALIEIPHGFTRRGSCIGASPATSET